MNYNVHVDCYSPGQVCGVVFLCGNTMTSDAQGANFGPEMSALDNGFKSRFGGDNVPFFYTLSASSPGKPHFSIPLHFHTPIS